VVLLANGWSVEQVADALLVDPNTVRNHFKRYQQGGLAALGLHPTFHHGPVANYNRAAAAQQTPAKNSPQEESSSLRLCNALC
jgi:predicted ArsR family transcriptional regulator